jgi:hypothetical protein
LRAACRRRRELIRREQAYAEEHAIDDARRIPLLDRIAGAVADVGREAGLSEREADDLHVVLVGHARKLWLELCLSHVPEAVDRDADRRGPPSSPGRSERPRIRRKLYMAPSDEVELYPLGFR